MKIVGAENMSQDQLRFEIQPELAGKIVVDCTNAIAKGLPWTGLSLLAGWWGIPWGPIWTIQALVTNLRGGKDVTAEIAGRLQPSPRSAAASIS